jgi:peptidoglycan/LPS O-acetylase OafA/YrhL
MMTGQKTEYFTSLEGIRGYAFLAVFLLHYNTGSRDTKDLVHYAFYLMDNVCLFLVPIFFVLSGFLITRVLLATRERGGYFRIFYLRRAVRVLPLYYGVLAAIFLVATALHWIHLSPHYLIYFIYLQNFTLQGISTKIWTGHLWSLAVEEQFYLLWPVAIWFLRTEQSLLKFSYGLIAVCTLFRFAWPLWGIPSEYAYTITPTRVDGIILGAALAIHFKNTVHWDRYVLAAKMSIPVLLSGMLALTLWKGTAFPVTYVGVSLGIPAINLLGLAFVILALTPGSLVARVSSGSNICKFGKLSYGMYVFHYLYAAVFVMRVQPILAHHMPGLVAEVATNLLALGVTLTLASLSFKYFEEPFMNLKEKFKYGPTVERPVRVPWFSRPGLSGATE